MKTSAPPSHCSFFQEFLRTRQHGLKPDLSRWSQMTWTLDSEFSASLHTQGQSQGPHHDGSGAFPTGLLPPSSLTSCLSPHRLHSTHLSLCMVCTHLRAFALAIPCAWDAPSPAPIFPWIISLFSFWSLFKCLLLSMSSPSHYLLNPGPPAHGTTSVFYFLSSPSNM